MRSWIVIFCYYDLQGKMIYTTHFNPNEYLSSSHILWAKRYKAMEKGIPEEEMMLVSSFPVDD